MYGLISITASRDNVTRFKFFHTWNGKVRSGGRTLPVKQYIVFNKPFQYKKKVNFKHQFLKPRLRS